MLSENKKLYNMFIKMVGYNKAGHCAFQDRLTFLDQMTHFCAVHHEQKIIPGDTEETFISRQSLEPEFFDLMHVFKDNSSFIALCLGMSNKFSYEKLEDLEAAN